MPCAYLLDLFVLGRTPRSSRDWHDNESDTAHATAAWKAFSPVTGERFPRSGKIMDIPSKEFPNALYGTIVHISTHTDLMRTVSKKEVVHYCLSRTIEARVFLEGSKML